MIMNFSDSASEGKARNKTKRFENLSKRTWESDPIQKLDFSILQNPSAKSSIVADFVLKSRKL
jgi:hypothetical protein